MLRKQPLSLLLFTAAFLFFPGNDLFACSTFLLENGNQKVFGRNYDFSTGEAHISINKRGLHKTSFTLPPEKAFSWNSKYGSISFNQYGREFSVGGMNEAGLVVEVMILLETVYPEPDKRSGLMETQWVQYQLDSFATVDEVLDSTKNVRISNNSFAGLHFLVADRTGNAAILEYIKGKLKIYNRESLPVKALTNSSYHNSLNFLKKKVKKDESLERFRTASQMLRKYKGKKDSIIDYSFKILNEVSIPGATRWQIVYDMNNMQIHYMSDKTPELRTLSFKNIDFASLADSLYIDIHHSPGEQLKKYNYEDNRALLERVSKKVSLISHLPDQFWDKVASYPNTVTSVSALPFSR